MSKKWPVRGLRQRRPARAGADRDVDTGDHGSRVHIDVEQWQVRIDPKRIGERERWFDQNAAFEHAVRMPFAVQNIKALSAEHPPTWYSQNGYLGNSWARASVTVPESWRDRRTHLNFGGIMPAGHVWLNGYYVGYADHPLVSVAWDVTDFVAFGADNTLTIELVEHNPEAANGVRSDKMPWQGLYRTVELVNRSAVSVEQVCVRPNIDRGDVTVSARLAGTDAPQNIDFIVVVSDPDGRQAAEVRQNAVETAPEGADVVVYADIPDFSVWEPDNPYLYIVDCVVEQDGKKIDSIRERFGMRSFCVNGNRLELNGRPFFLRAYGDDTEAVFIPDLTPKRDKAIIRERIRAAKAMGFNGVRNHTHPATPEELDVCDELGFLVHDEMGVISNFNFVEPYPIAVDQWREHIIESRNHPSVITYCMGNEGSQIVGRDKELQRRAREYYSIAKELAPDRLVIYASGTQGEHPDVPADYETPHLWGRGFKQTYEGMARVSWEYLRKLGARKPCVLHEYGKMTVWPDPEEEALFDGYAYRAIFAQAVRDALARHGLESMTPALVRNSRRLAVQCNKIVVEMPRRHPWIDGYHFWSFFRNTFRSTGLVDDFGRNFDVDPNVFIQSNGPTALLIDRDFAGRTLVYDQPTRIGVHLSHFGDSNVTDAQLSWRIHSAGKLLAEGSQNVGDFQRGNNGKLCDVVLSVPSAAHPRKLSVGMTLKCPGGTAGNEWDFWAFPWVDPAQLRDNIIVTGSTEFEDQICRYVPYAVKGEDALVTADGLRGMRVEFDPLFARDWTPSFIITDRINERLIQYASAGGVLLVIPGRGSTTGLRAGDPDGRHKPGKDYYNIYEYFPPFRAGWDHGNAATVIEDHPLLNEFPHDGYCDLQFFELVHGSAPFSVTTLRDTVGDVQPLIWSFPLMRGGNDPSGYTKKDTTPHAYLTETRVGDGIIIGYAMNLSPTPAAMYLFTETVSYCGKLARDMKEP